MIASFRYVRRALRGHLLYPTREAWAEEIADEVFEWQRQLEAILSRCVPM